MKSSKWLIDQKNLTVCDEATLDRIFSISNGFIGCAGTNPLASKETYGALMGGVYYNGPFGRNSSIYYPEIGHSMRHNEKFPTDEHIFDAIVTGCVIFPNLFSIEVMFNGEKPIKNGNCERTLDMKNGVLKTQVKLYYSNSEIDITSERFISLANICLISEKLTISSTQKGEVNIRFIQSGTIDEKYFTEQQPIINMDSVGVKYLLKGSQQEVCIISDINSNTNTLHESETDSEIGMKKTFEIDANEVVVFEKYMGVAATILHKDVIQEASQAILKAKADGYEASLKEHSDEWRKFWENHEISIDTETEDETAMTYCIFQTRCGMPPNTSKFSAGARFLTGISHAQGVFWDDDIFIFPYFTKTAPEFTKNHLIYRYNQLSFAKSNAKEEGYEGAQYVWATGGDGSVTACLPFYMMNYTQIHITADIIWGLMN